MASEKHEPIDAALLLQRLMTPPPPGSRLFAAGEPSCTHDTHTDWGLSQIPGTGK